MENEQWHRMDCIVHHNPSESDVVTECIFRMSNVAMVMKTQSGCAEIHFLRSMSMFAVHTVRPYEEIVDILFPKQT